MLDLAILGLLTEHELHGYELKKRLAELLGSRLAVSFGSLYPALSRLEKAGAVEAVVGTPDATPMTGSLGAEVAALRARRRPTGRGQRNKKVYAITPAGEARLRQLLVEPAADDRTFSLQIAFCSHLPNELRLVLFDRRRAELLTREAEIVAAAPALPGPAARYRGALRDRELAALRSELTWLDGLLADERQAPATAGAPVDGAASSPTRIATDPTPAAVAVGSTSPSTLGPPSLSGGVSR
jgi:DNA-binding PadR family transcriptional regulator